MSGELPVCKRCCFCVPLRYGLLVWGYIKLIIGLFLIIIISVNVYYLISSLMSESCVVGHEERICQTDFDEYIIVPLIALAISLMDFVLGTIFIIGGHMKNVKLLSVFYFYSIAFWVLTLLLTILMIAQSIKNLSSHNASSFYWIVSFLRLPNFFAIIVIQTYFLILLKSEIIKLKNNCQFRFVNNAAESEVTMKYGEELESGEKGFEETGLKGTFNSNEMC